MKDSPWAKAERGMAVIVALLSVAIASSIAAYLLWQQNLMLRAVGNQREQSQLFQVEYAALDLIMTVLREDKRYTMADHYGELWAVPMPETDFEDWKISGRVYDAQSRFNINSMVKHGVADVTRVEQYRKLLVLLDLPPELADTLVDWIDSDNTRYSGNGAEDDDYLSMKPPYRAANDLMADLTNLVRVKGYTPEVIEKLSPYIIALPEETPVNVNTASPEVLAAVVIGLSLEDAKALVQSRDRVYLNDVQEIHNRLPGRQLQIVQYSLSINTSYFLVEGQIIGNGASRFVRTLLWRERYGFPIVMWRQQL